MSSAIRRRHSVESFAEQGLHLHLGDDISDGDPVGVLDVDVIQKLVQTVDS